MSKIINTKDLKLGELNTVVGYIEYLKTKSITTTKQAIHYQMDNTENLDWCLWQGNRLIHMNNKAKTFTPKRK